MANPLFEQFGRNQNNGPFNMIQDLRNQITQLKNSGIDPNRKIQEMLNSGQITQQQYNAAVQKAQQLQQLLGR